MARAVPPKERRSLAALGIECVIDLRAERSDDERAWPEAVRVTAAPLIDHVAPSVDELRAVASSVTQLLKQGRQVLVHCQAGIERTPLVVCATLLMLGWSLDDAYRRVMECRPDAAPTEGQLAALRALASGV
jgi:atypical dual specificity phosphatase